MACRMGRSIRGAEGIITRRGKVRSRAITGGSLQTASRRRRRGRRS
jgi:hypothetical protein